MVPALLRFVSIGFDWCVELGRLCFQISKVVHVITNIIKLTNTTWIKSLQDCQEAWSLRDNCVAVQMGVGSPVVGLDVVHLGCCSNSLYLPAVSHVPHDVRKTRNVLHVAFEVAVINFVKPDQRLEYFYV